MIPDISWRLDQISNSRTRIMLDGLPRALQQKLRGTIQQLVNELLPQVLQLEPRRTGRLRSLTHAYVDERGTVQQNWVRGRVRVLRTREHNTAAAAGALEYGARRRFPVRAYTSRRTVVFGRRIRPPKIITVKAHERRQRIVAMRFLRGPAKAWLPRARAELERTIIDALKDPRFN